MKYTMRLVTES